MDKVDKYLAFIKKNQSKWIARGKRDFTKNYKNKTMGNSMTKYRDQIEQNNLKSLKQGILKKGVVYFNSNGHALRNMEHRLNEFINNEYIYELRSAKITISQIREIQSALYLLIKKVSYDSEEEMPRANSLISSIRLDYEIRSLDLTITDKYYKMLEK